MDWSSAVEDSDTVVISGDIPENDDNYRGFAFVQFVFVLDVGPRVGILVIRVLISSPFIHFSRQPYGIVRKKVLDEVFRKLYDE